VKWGVKGGEQDWMKKEEWMKSRGIAIEE